MRSDAVFANRGDAVEGWTPREVETLNMKRLKDELLRMVVDGVEPHLNVGDILAQPDFEGSREKIIWDGFCGTPDLGW